MLRSLTRSLWLWVIKNHALRLPLYHQHTTGSGQSDLADPGSVPHWYVFLLLHCLAAGPGLYVQVLWCSPAEQLPLLVASNRWHSSVVHNSFPFLLPNGCCALGFICWILHRQDKLSFPVCCSVTVKLFQPQGLAANEKGLCVVMGMTKKTVM